MRSSYQDKAYEMYERAMEEIKSKILTAETYLCELESVIDCSDMDNNSKAEAEELMIKISNTLSKIE